MKIIKQSCSLEYPIVANVLQVIEKIGRTAYKSEDKITKDSAEKFIRMILEPSRKHESVIEHVVASMRFITDRGVTHEMVRHRIASYTQESTRYCDYSKKKFGRDITFILPIRYYASLKDFSERSISDCLSCNMQFRNWFLGCTSSTKTYFEALDLGEKPQEARDVLCHSLKTEIVTTMNLREWRHFFKLRKDKSAHPQIRELATQAHNILSSHIKIIFEENIL